MSVHPDSPSSWARYRRCPREYAFWREEQGVDAEGARASAPDAIETSFAGGIARVRHAGILGDAVRIPYGSKRASWRARAALAIARRARPDLRPMLVDAGGGEVPAPRLDAEAIEAEVAALRVARAADAAFRPRVGPWCERCRWRARCPAFVRPSSRMTEAFALLADAPSDLPAARRVGAAAAAALGLDWRAAPGGSGILHPVGRDARWGWIAGAGSEAAEFALALALALDRARARDEADRDALTGLYARGWFESRMPAAPPPDFALVLLDIDRFKSVNDLRGHATGDSALAHVARLLAAAAAARGAEAFRYGGEEMGALGPLPPAAARELAEAARAAVAAAPLDAPGGPLALTVSLGVGAARAGEDRAGFFARVDAALYRAKERGRNRVELAE